MNPQPAGDFEPIHKDFHTLNPTSCCLEISDGPQPDAIPSEPTLSSLDRDIACLNSVVEKLNRTRLNKIRLRNQYVPICSLPSEILQEIFIACLDPDIANGTTQYSSVPISLRLAHICFLWRKIALELPILWTTVNCRVPHPRNSMGVAESIFDWLARSKEYPLNIHISFENDRLWSVPDAPTHIIDILALFAERWKDVALTLPPTWQIPLSSVKGRLDNLETLRIQPPPPMTHFYLLDAFSVAPKLSTLSFERFYLQNLAFPWANLTKAAIRQASSDEVLEFISRCPLLTECFIMHPVGDEGNFPWPANGVTHGGMKDLTIKLQRNDQRPEMMLREILGYLVMPSLERLTVLLEEIDNPLLDLSLLIERSGCPLSEIEIFGPTISEGEIVDFICDNDCVSRITNNPKEVRTLSWTM